jgi:hypothetical protein
MSKIEDLLKAYERYVKLPWDHRLAGPQRVWFAEYGPSQERRLRSRISAFEGATTAAGHGWRLLDITSAFAVWMADHDYREAYFQHPEHIGMALSDFAKTVADQVRGALEHPDANEDTIVAIVGLASLFGFTRASNLIADVDSYIRGRLLVFFPGQHHGHNWRLLDARDGWNYHAVPISGSSER